MASALMAQKYSERNGIQLELGKQFVAKLNLHPGQKVLDMGCGTGELTEHIASQVDDGNVFGVDPDADRITIAFQKTNNTVRFTIGNHASAFPYSDEEFYDVHFSNFVFHWLNNEEKQEYFKCALRCLKHNGRLAIHAADKWPEPIGVLLEKAVMVGAMKPCTTFVEKTYVDSLCEQFHVQVLCSENLFYEFKFLSLDFFIAWTCATFYIDEAKFSSHVEKKCLRKFVNADGTVSFHHKAYQIVARKN